MNKLGWLSLRSDCQCTNNPLKEVRTCRPLLLGEILLTTTATASLLVVWTHGDGGLAGRDVITQGNATQQLNFPLFIQIEPLDNTENAVQYNPCCTGGNVVEKIIGA